MDLIASCSYAHRSFHGTSYLKRPISTVAILGGTEDTLADVFHVRKWVEGRDNALIGTIIGCPSIILAPRRASHIWCRDTSLYLRRLHALLSLKLLK